MIAALPNKYADNAFAKAAAARVDLYDFTSHRLDMRFFQVHDRAQVGKILIISREKENEVAGRANAQPAKQFRPLRPNAARELDRRGENFRRLRLTLRNRLRRRI